jgi:hypothetical protein
MGKNNFLKNEKSWTILLGGIGCIALTWNFINNPSDWPNILVNFAQIGVAVIVFFMTSNIISRIKGKRVDFITLFDEIIERWAIDNKYLVDSSQMFTSQSEKQDTRIIFMIFDLNSFGEKVAEDSKQKAAFLYLPSRDDSNKHSIVFKINQQLFSKVDDFDSQKEIILDKISSRIRERFSESLKLNTKVLKSELKVQVDFSKMEKTKENAERLKDVVEFVKTMILALA